MDIPAGPPETGPSWGVGSGSVASLSCFANQDIPIISSLDIVLPMLPVTSLILTLSHLHFGGKQ